MIVPFTLEVFDSKVFPMNLSSRTMTVSEPAPVCKKATHIQEKII